MIAAKPFWRQPLAAVLVCSALLILGIIPAVNSRMQAFDESAFRALNRAVGVTPVFDMALRFIADHEGRERLLGLLVIWFVVQLWRVPTRMERSRRLGTLLFLLVIMGVFFVVEDFLDDVVERESPSYVMKPFRSLNKIHGWDVDVTDKRTFPSAEAMVLFIVGFSLLRLGERRGGWTVMAAGMILPLGKCMAGSNWVSDIYLGSLPLAYLTTALTVETRFVILHEQLTSMTAAGLDQSERLLRQWRPMLQAGRQWWTSQNVFEMEVAVKRFVARELSQHVCPEAAETDAGLVRLEVPLGGLRSIVRIAECGGKKAVLRAYPISRNREAEQHMEAARLLEQYDVRAPKILHHLPSPRKYGAIFVIEEYIEGILKPPSELIQTDMQAAAIELARLHSVHGDLWGPISSPRTEDYATVALRRAERQLGNAAKGPILQGQADACRRMANWFHQWKLLLQDQKRYSLTHGKLHRENCMFEKNGRFCLLDNTTLEWGLPASDLLTVHNSLCDNQPHLIAWFNEAYYANFDEADAVRVQKTLPFFEALYLLGQVAKYTKRLARSEIARTGDPIPKGTHYWKRLLEVTAFDNT